jgi:hypothetical protein
VREPRADLTADHTDHQARGGGDADPRDRDATAAQSISVGPSGGGEGDDARRLIDLFETTHHLLLLGLQALGREHVVGQLGGVSLQSVHPSREGDGAVGADVAPIEVLRAFASDNCVDERALGQMTLAQNHINEPHG